MGIFRWLMQQAGCLGYPAAEIDDRALDYLIHEALVEEETAEPPAESWERLYLAARNRQMVRRHGMWVLDELLRDPPVRSRAVIYHNDSQRVAYGEHFSRTIHEIRGSLWISLPTSFVAISNW